MIFQVHFKEKVAEIEPVSLNLYNAKITIKITSKDLEAIIRASYELQHSKKLKKILEV